jgi:hypothetical protein
VSHVAADHRGVNVAATTEGHAQDRRAAPTARVLAIRALRSDSENLTVFEGPSVHLGIFVELP